MARGKNLVKCITLLILIIILVVFGIIWFDYLGVIQAKKFVSPIFKLIGLTPQTTTAVSSLKDLKYSDLDDDRFAKRLEALDYRTEELDKRENDIKLQEDTNAQIALELQEKENEQLEREKTFDNLVKKYDERNLNIVAIVENLNGMPPANSVSILENMNDQDVIDVLRKEKEMALENGTSSMGAYWLSLMKPERAAEIQRKMANKPASLD